MSTLANKHILFIGKEDKVLTALKNELVGSGAKVSTSSTDDFIKKSNRTAPIDLIILNKLKDGPDAEKLFEHLKTSNLATDIPVFWYIKDATSNIQNSLLEGAADYITQNEKTDSAVQKIEAIFNDESEFSGSSSIDISPTEINLSTKGVRVFVVEDDPLLRNLLSIRLERSTFPHEFSSDGKDIIPLLRKFSPDVIILDIMLPGISGFEVLKEIKEDEKLQNVSIIVFSNRDGSEDRSKASALGADRFYVKAMTDLSELVLTIENLAKEKKEN